MKTLDDKAKAEAKIYNIALKHVTAPDEFIKRTFADGFKAGYAERDAESTAVLNKILDLILRTQGDSRIEIIALIKAFKEGGND